jgi:hypothetical protein
MPLGSLVSGYLRHIGAPMVIGINGVLRCRAAYFLVRSREVREA